MITCNNVLAYKPANTLPGITGIKSRLMYIPAASSTTILLLSMPHAASTLLADQIPGTINKAVTAGMIS